MSEAIREGGCACGTLRYRLRGEPIFVNNCHCRQCQQQTGGTSVVNAFTETESFELLSGELTQHTVRSGSGGPHRIFRCARCSIAIFSHYPRLGELGLGLRVGTLDEPASLTPDAVVFTAERMPWATLPDGIPQFEAYYDPAQVLPPERLARLKDMIRRRESGESKSEAAPLAVSASLALTDEIAVSDFKIGGFRGQFQGVFSEWDKLQPTGIIALRRSRRSMKNDVLKPIDKEVGGMRGIYIHFNQQNPSLVYIGMTLKCLSSEISEKIKHDTWLDVELDALDTNGRRDTIARRLKKSHPIMWKKYLRGHIDWYNRFAQTSIIRMFGLSDSIVHEIKETEKALIGSACKAGLKPTNVVARNYRGPVSPSVAAIAERIILENKDVLSKEDANRWVENLHSMKD